MSLFLPLEADMQSRFARWGHASHPVEGVSESEMQAIADRNGWVLERHTLLFTFRSPTRKTFEMPVKKGRKR